MTEQNSNFGINISDFNLNVETVNVGGIDLDIGFDSLFPETAFPDIQDDDEANTALPEVEEEIVEDTALPEIEEDVVEDIALPEVEEDIVEDTALPEIDESGEPEVSDEPEVIVPVITSEEEADEITEEIGDNIPDYSVSVDEDLYEGMEGLSGSTGIPIPGQDLESEPGEFEEVAHVYAAPYGDVEKIEFGVTAVNKGVTDSVNFHVDLSSQTYEITNASGSDLISGQFVTGEVVEENVYRYEFAVSAPDTGHEQNINILVNSDTEAVLFENEVSTNIETIQTMGINGDFYAVSDGAQPGESSFTRSLFLNEEDPSSLTGESIVDGELFS